MKKLLFILGITTCLADNVEAGLVEGMLAYQYKQYPTAFAEFNYLANEGDPAANYYLGKLYQEGLGAPKNEGRAFSLFQAADSGYYFPATAELGKMLLNGAGQTPPDPQKAVALLKKAAHAGESDASFMLGQAYAFGTNVEPNLNYAYGYYLLSALSGNMKAQYALAKLYFEGRGIPQDYTEALKWMTRSANQGYVLAQIELADIYMANQRLKNAAKAYSWYSIIAAYNIDEIGYKAKEKRDALEEGLESRVLSAQQASVRSWKPTPAEESVPQKEKDEAQIPQIPGFNDAQSLQDLLISEGYLPQNGQKYGITTRMVDEAIAYQNADELARKIDSVARKGKTGAYGYLGDLYKTRLADLSEAFNWYKKGAEAGDSYAEYQLAKMYCEGQGIEQPDAAACYAWLKIAQKEQNPILNGLIQNALNLVEQNATQEELSAGRELMKTLEKSPEEKETKKSGVFNFF